MMRRRYISLAHTKIPAPGLKNYPRRGKNMLRRGYLATGHESDPNITPGAETSFCAGGIFYIPGADWTPRAGGKNRCTHPNNSPAQVYFCAPGVMRGYVYIPLARPKRLLITDQIVLPLNLGKIAPRRPIDAAPPPPRAPASPAVRRPR